MWGTDGKTTDLERKPNDVDIASWVDEFQLFHELLPRPLFVPTEIDGRL